MRKFRVALLIETSGGYGRAIQAGVSRFMRVRNDWSVFIEERDHRSIVPEWIYDWDGDGIISRIANERLWFAAKQKRMPLVSLADDLDACEFPMIRSDNRMIGQMAAEHLLKIGHQRFAFCGFSKLAWSVLRYQGFVEHLSRHGYSDCECFETDRFGEDANTWDEECQALEAWIEQLPKPVGMLAASDIRGNQVTAACSSRGVAVPEEIAVVGVDNDALICELSSPRLSSIKPNSEMVGYAAAEALTTMMLGERVIDACTAIPPTGIAKRQSTDTFATDDKDVSTALRFIRENACTGVSVADVAANGRISRSTLERRMREAIDRTPQQQIRHVQVSRVCELLVDSDEPLARIASICGFEHAEYMHVVFKREMGQTPGGFRRSAVERDSRFR